MRSLTSTVTLALGLASSGGASAFTGAPLAARAGAAALARAGALRRAGSLAMADVSLKPKGNAETQEYRVFFSSGGKDISPWHDIPLKVRLSPTQHALAQAWEQIAGKSCVPAQLKAASTGLSLVSQSLY
jgi:hypothetical protein